MTFNIIDAAKQMELPASAEQFASALEASRLKIAGYGGHSDSLFYEFGVAAVKLFACIMTTAGQEVTRDSLVDALKTQGSNVPRDLLSGTLLTLFDGLRSWDESHFQIMLCEAYVALGEMDCLIIGPGDLEVRLSNKSLPEQTKA